MRRYTCWLLQYYYIILSGVRLLARGEPKNKYFFDIYTFTVLVFSLHGVRHKGDKHCGEMDFFSLDFCHGSKSVYTTRVLRVLNLFLAVADCLTNEYLFRCDVNYNTHSHLVSAISPYSDMVFTWLIMLIYSSGINWYYFYNSIGDSQQLCRDRVPIQRWIQQRSHNNGISYSSLYT